MNKISCDICIDLMSLVHDGVASEDSRNAVHNHLQDCPSCKSLYEGEIPLPSGENQLSKKVQRRAQTFSFMVMIFGIFYGLMLTAKSGIFQNVLIMPIIGSIGYYLFRIKALYIIPSLLFITHAITNALGLGGEHLDPVSLVIWTAIYCVAAFIGFLIALLLHFALGKENS